jgi:hypothetical protein
MATKVDAPAAQLSGVQLYSRFALAGAICCSVTHGALTPVDVYVSPIQALRGRAVALLRCVAMRTAVLPVFIEAIRS